MERESVAESFLLMLSLISPCVWRPLSSPHAGIFLAHKLAVMQTFKNELC